MCYFIISILKPKHWFAISSPSKDLGFQDYVDGIVLLITRYSLPQLRPSLRLHLLRPTPSHDIRVIFGQAQSLTKDFLLVWMTK